MVTVKEKTTVTQRIRGNCPTHSRTEIAGRDVSTQEPKKAFDLEKAAAVKLKGMGIKIVTDVDKSGFIRVATPYLDKLAKELGPHAVKIKDLISAVK